MEPEPITTTKEERLWAMFCHISAFVGHFIPFGNIAGPLVIWMIKKDSMPLVNDQGKESLNAQISFTIYFIIAALLMLVLIGFVLLPILWIWYIVVIIIASVQANDGKAYRYKAIFRFIQ